MADDQELQRRVDALLTATDDAPDEGPPAFSPFFGDGVIRAGELAALMHERAERADLDAAIAAAEEAAVTEPTGLVKRAVKVFVTHEPTAAGRLHLPLVEALETEAIEGAPSRPQPPTGLPRGIPGAPPRGDGAPPRGRLEAAPPPVDRPSGEDWQELPSLTEPAAERALDWYREDPFANDHHAHWHIVYRRDGGGPRPIQPRHGELFFYMHQQMLARYDTERVIAGLGPVEPHPPRRDGPPDYSAAIPEGYGSPGYTRRRPGRSFAEVPGAVEGCARDHAALQRAIDDGRLDLGDGVDRGPLTETQLGSATEAGALRIGDAVVSLADVAARFGNLHGNGHGNVGQLGEPPDPLRWGGVMFWTETAICDPFFYRWHRNVDDFYARFQEATGETNDPADFAPPGVSFGTGRAVALALSRDIPGAEQPGFDFDGFARATLGGDLAGSDALLTDQLLTRFVRSRVSAGIPSAGPAQRVSYTTTHLTHEPFTSFLRLENAGNGPTRVTVRMFLCLAALADERRAWIELDKFDAALAPGVNVVARPDARSSVIKRRGVTAPGAEPLEAGAADQWCDCGWPYSLLLPSGASAAGGAAFKLMAAVTDHAKDREPDHVRTCGSMSYCGALENYPDRRNMGYPFDRPFAGMTVSEALEATPSMAVVDLTIRCENARPPE